jgi:hypothetical protein
MGRIARTSGSYTLSGTTAAAIDATNLSIRLECTGNPIRLRLNGILQPAATNNILTSVYPAMDGALVTLDGFALADYQDFMSQNALQPTISVSAEWIGTPAAGSHLFTWWYRVAGGNWTLFATTGVPLLLTVEELAHSASSSNGAA